MNHTHGALLALLLPLSGYAITKEERKKEIEIEFVKLDEEINHLVKLIENNLFFASFCPDYFTERAQKIDARGAELQAELQRLEEELNNEK